VPPLGIVINEVMANPRRLFDSLGEWFELYNNGNTIVNLQNWKVVGNPTTEFFLISPTSPAFSLQVAFMSWPGLHWR
jgi:Lamin Tail Domain